MKKENLKMMVEMRKEKGVEIKTGIAEKEDLEGHTNNLRLDLDPEKVLEVQ